MKTCFVTVCAMALLAVSSGRPQGGNFGSANAAAFGIQIPGFQKLNVNAHVEQFHSNNNPGVFESSNSLALGTGIQFSGPGQQTSNIQTHATSNQNTRPIF